MASETRPPTFKISLLGEAAVGKTSIIQRFINNKFANEYKMTIGMEPYTRYEMLDGEKIIYSIWDIGGEERFRSTQSMFMKGVSGSLVIFDLTRRITFEKMVHWIDKSRKYNPEQEFVIIGNKNDLEDKRQVETVEGEEKAEEINAVTYLETSAKTGENIEDAFKRMGRILMNKL